MKIILVIYYTLKEIFGIDDKKNVLDSGFNIFKWIKLLSITIILYVLIRLSIDSVYLASEVIELEKKELGYLNEIKNITKNCKTRKKK